jgi:tetratricopeptide (TPR) repeat protein/outer membrane protein OmpA-like peptidoglycan-associated protein
MKKIVCCFLIFTFAFAGFSQAKKNLSAKKSTLKPASKKTVKEEPVIVYNEDYEKGEELFGLNRPEEAIPYFEKCVDVKDVNPNVWIHLGVAYYQTGDFTRSLACCTKGLTKENTDHKILAYNAGNSAYALTNYARADACYAIALKEDENFAPAYLNRANSQLKQDHLQDAKENYIKYLEKEPASRQKDEIERLIALLDAEIIRRAKEKPEKIDLDFANVKNDEMIVSDDAEKVDLDLPEEKKHEEKRPQELVKAEIETAPVEKEELVLQHVKPDDMPVEKEEEPLIAELVEKDAANPPAPVLIEGAQKFESDKIASAKQKETPVKGEAFHEEDLADAIYNLPAGSVSLAPVSFGFSPNSSDSKYKKEHFTVSASDSGKIASYIFEILDESGNTVRTMKGKKLPSKLEWDGRTDEGILGDGRYTSRITVDYKQGGSVTAESAAFRCFSDVPQVSLASQTENFSPDGDGVDDLMKFKVNFEGQTPVDNWRFEVKRNNKTIYSHSENGTPPSDIEWDGKTSSGETVKNGDKLSYSMSVTDSFGVQAQDSGKTEVTKSKPDPVVAKKVEVSENLDGTVDIQIPTLSFKINSSDLINTSSNNDTIKKVYDILVDEKFEDYKVTITGYVNPDGEKWTNEEIMLALRRAQSVENKLRELGVDSNRMKAVAGDGKTNNKEYNRRVEFKLEK